MNERKFIRIASVLIQKLRGKKADSPDNEAFVYRDSATQPAGTAWEKAKTGRNVRQRATEDWQELP
jgi:hypothetical protein